MERVREKEREREREGERKQKSLLYERWRVNETCSVLLQLSKSRETVRERERERERKHGVCVCEFRGKRKFASSNRGAGVNQWMERCILLHSTLTQVESWLWLRKSICFIDRNSFSLLLLFHANRNFFSLATDPSLPLSFPVNGHSVYKLMCPV